jgi:hypothetical protein
MKIPVMQSLSRWIVFWNFFDERRRGYAKFRCVLFSV